MLSGQEQVDTISHNLANAATPAFKKTKVTQCGFSQMIARIQAQQHTSIQRTSLLGTMGMGTRVDNTWMVAGQGSLRFTDDRLQAAINGPGFYVVATSAGERYTRDGRFRVNNEGWLVTPDGNKVLGEQGPIQVAGIDAALGGSGEVMANGRQIDRLRIVDFPEVGQLMREGSNSYSQGAAGTPFAISGDLSPGFIEEANVNAVSEMVDLIAATRYYEANQKTIQAEDDTLSKAVNEVGRVS